MPVHVQWDNDDHTVIQLVFEGKWGLEELYPALSEMYKSVEQEQHIVDSIVDMVNASTIPSNVLSIRGTIERNQPDNQGISVIVGANTLVRSIANILNRVLKEESEYIFTDTLEEARQAIKDQRQRESS